MKYLVFLISNSDAFIAFQRSLNLALVYCLVGGFYYTGTEHLLNRSKYAPPKCLCFSMVPSDFVRRVPDLLLQGPAGVPHR